MSKIGHLQAANLQRLSRTAKAAVYVFETMLPENTQRFADCGFGPVNGAVVEHPCRPSVVPKVAFRSVQVHPGDCSIE
jgi:hypothetical protein